MLKNNANERPTLDKNISVEDFRDFYWLKEELQDFCRFHGIAASGQKIDIAQRIEKFLTTGEVISKVIRKEKIKHSEDEIFCQTYKGALSLDTVIGPKFKCSQECREFFKSVIPNFHFSTNIQNFFKQNPDKTFADAINEWHREQELKRNKDYKTQIAPQFEYNQFTRDFFNDPNNKGKTRKDAIEAWKKKRSMRGDNKYNPEDMKSEEQNG